MGNFLNSANPFDRFYQLIGRGLYWVWYVSTNLQWNVNSPQR